MVLQQTLINGRYEILHELGAGGSGCVYAAIDRITKSQVAVKLFGHHIKWDRTAREKFEVEVSVSGHVNSEHIVRVLDAGLDAMTQLPFIVMELLQGTNLQEVVEQETRICPALAVEYLRQVASGLDKAHAWVDGDQRVSPIVHRDLKPSNLFLTHHEDGAPWVKIVDWGIAKVLSNSATMSRDLKGTPLYMAPEQLQGEPVTSATDIWALGLVAFFLLTGQCYWKSGQHADTVLPALIKEVSEGPKYLPRARSMELQVDIELAPAFDEWFMRCVHLDPARRFPTAGEAVCALSIALGLSRQESRAAADEVPLTITPAPPLSAIAGVRQRTKLAWIIAGAVVVLLSAIRFGSHSPPTATPTVAATLPSRALTDVRAVAVSPQRPQESSSSIIAPPDPPMISVSVTRQTPIGAPKSSSARKVPTASGQIQRQVNQPLPSNTATTKLTDSIDRRSQWDQQKNDILRNHKAETQ